MRSLGDLALPALVNPAGGNPEGHMKNRADGLAFNLDCAIAHFHNRREDHSKQDTEKLIEFGREQVRRAAQLCESPIECQILPWLIFSNYEPLTPGPIPVHNQKLDSRVPDWPLVLVPQFSISKSRFDFVLLARANGFSKIVAIECDGAAYHEDVRDFQRDQYFADWGITTIRMSGSEINGNARHIVELALRSIEDWSSKVAA